MNVAIDLDLEWLSPLGSPATRAALAAVLNLGVVILGGRTCYIANFLGISLQFYYLIHHWVARIAFLQSLIHAGMRIRQQNTWTATAGMGLAVSNSSRFSGSVTYTKDSRTLRNHQSIFLVPYEKKVHRCFHMVS
jgi:hypothetical protein